MLQVVQLVRAVNNLLLKKLKNTLQIVGSGSVRGFRRTRSAQKSMYYEGVKMFNALPIDVKSCERIEQFKRMLKEYILSIQYNLPTVPFSIVLFTLIRA